MTEEYHKRYGSAMTKIVDGIERRSTYIENPCGTLTGRRRHTERKEKPCAPCREASRKAAEKYRLENADARKVYAKGYRARNPHVIEKLKYKSAAVRLILAQYKVNKGCTDCGYNKHASALEFDHVGDDKDGNVATSVGWKMSRLIDEIMKCEVVCANCHRERTATRRLEKKQLASR